MKRYLALILILPALALAQSRFGHGALTVSSMLPIISDSADVLRAEWKVSIADSSKWKNSTTHGNALTPRFGKSIILDSLFVDYAAFTSNVILNTVAGEQLKLGTGSDAAPELSSAGDPNTGIRFPGSDITTFVQGGAEKVRISPNGLGFNTTTPMAGVHYSASSISSFPTTNLPVVKALRLGNPDAATAGVQAYSPALLFKGAGWKTDATAGSDSVLAAMYLVPAQAASAPTSQLYMDFKIGTASWINRFTFNNSGRFGAVNVIASNQVSGAYISGAFANSNSYIICDASADNNTRFISFGRGGYATPATEFARFTYVGNLGLGTTTPQAKFSVVGADGTGTGIHVVSSDVNLRRDSWAQAIDTSSVAIRLDSAGNPRIGFAAADGDSARIHVRTDSTVFASVNPIGINTPAVNINHKAVFTDSARVEKTTILKGNVTIGSGTAWWSAQDSLVVSSGATRNFRKRSMPDDGTYVPATGVCGKGFVRSDAEHITFTFIADGTVTLGTDCSINIDDADTDDKLCVYDNGSGIIIKNRLGSTKNVLIDLEYMTP